ncbi:uncharacterized protein LOC107719520 isoform X1 [Sinocyclocheilus rhinocerous]|uniref:uncharacterized protein LOC107719520 isoform X1 n=1 Tax=Sinocyclocheilus rhinocerous TaxID=307959 RepID=UPI0007B7E5D9|nr:PREDICTED: uncharacterized protein LOC107719520 isoform X1 [Sinocyclocheilus rhinocerous]
MSFTMLKLLLLLLWVFNYSETIPIHVAGKKGGSVILPCEFKAREIFLIHLNRQSKNILVYDKKYCSKRVCKKGACDVVIKDLRLSDAGKYILNVYYNNAKSVLEPQIRTYHLHIYDDISVKIGEQLKLDVLLPDAHQVMHQNKSSTEWKKVWKRDSKSRVNVAYSRLTDSDGTLTIKEFTSDDAGAYRVLGYEGEILITVTVTDEKKSEGNLNYMDDDKKRNHWSLFGPAGLFVSVVFALPVLILIAAIIKKMQ